MSLLRFVVLGGLVAVVVGLVACGRSPYRGARGLGSHGPWVSRDLPERVDAVLDRLDATAEQRTRVQRIVGKAAVDVEPWRDAVARLADDLRAEWRRDHPDRDALHRRIDAELEALRTLSHALADDAVDLHATLTPEQRTRLTTMAERHRGRRRHRHQRPVEG